MDTVPPFATIYPLDRVTWLKPDTFDAGAHYHCEQCRETVREYHSLCGQCWSVLAHHPALPIRPFGQTVTELLGGGPWPGGGG